MTWLPVIWKCKWGTARLIVAMALLWSFSADTGARLARLQLSALPGYDYLGQARELRAKGRFGEAGVVIDAGLAADSGASTEARDSLKAERDGVRADSQSWLRRAKGVGWGALTGRGESLEELIGAVGTDLLVVGDVRDLVIQGVKQAVDGDSDEVILLLSGLGVVTTLAPSVDWAPSILKAARKGGALTGRLADEIVTLLRAGRRAEGVKVLEDVGALAAKATPGGAVRLVRLADSPSDLAAMARFVERSERGAFALGSTGRAGLDLLAEGGVAAEKVVVKAAGKAGGGAFLRSPAARALLRPHPLIGVAKGLYKSTIPELAVRVVEAMDARAWWFIPLLASWVVVESGLIVRRVQRSR